MRRIHPSSSSLLVLAVFALVGCGKEGGVTGLAKQHRAEVDTFTTKLLGVESKLASAPTKTSGFELPPGESLRMWGHDKPANTLVIEQSAFRDVVANHAVRDNFSRPDVEPETDSDLLFLVATTYAPRNDGDEDNNIEVYQRALAWFPNIRYVAVVIATEKRNYSTADTEVAARWHGRVAVFDLVGGRWIGAVAVALEGEPVDVSEYVEVDTRTNQEVSGPFKLLDRDISSARYAFNNLLDGAVKQSIETGKSVTSASQIASKR